MKKPRDATPEEKRLWRATTRHDTVFKPEAKEDLPEAAFVEDTPATPAPVATPDPAPRKAAALPPLAMLDGRKANRLLKPYAPVEATLDLHGLGKVAAYEAVLDFVDRSRRAGLRHVLIITGKGREGEGILRASLPQWLAEPGLRRHIVGIAHPHAGKGGTGVVHVILKRAR